MIRQAARVGFVLTLLCLASTPAFAQAEPSIRPDAGDEEAGVKDVVDGVMRPYLRRNSLPGAIVGASLHGRRHFFSYGQANDAGVPFTADTLVEIGSCTKTFTATLFALAVNRNQIDPIASVQKYMPSGYTLQPEARPMTPLELADFTSGMPDDPINLPHRWDMRSIEHYTTKDFLRWVSHWMPATRVPRLRSTARDMLSFGEANLGHKEVNAKPVSDEVIAAMQLAQMPIYTKPYGIDERP